MASKCKLARIESSEVPVATSEVAILITEVPSLTQ
jgi:hypothetical protein